MNFMKIQKFVCNFQKTYVVQTPFRFNFQWDVRQELTHLAMTHQDTSPITCDIFSPQNLSLVKIPMDVVISGDIIDPLTNTVDGSKILRIEKPI
jgi:hypothetical protein